MFLLVLSNILQILTSGDSSFNQCMNEHHDNEHHDNDNEEEQMHRQIAEDIARGYLEEGEAEGVYVLNHSSDDDNSGSSGYCSDNPVGGFLEQILAIDMRDAGTNTENNTGDHQQSQA